MKKVLTLLVTLVLGISAGCREKDSPLPFPDAVIDTRVLAENLRNPWNLVWGPDNFIWLTERAGKVSRVHPETGAITPLATLPEVRAVGEGGLLGMVLHPSFSTNPEVFLAYNYDKAGVYTAKIVKYTYTGSALTNPVNRDQMLNC